MISSKTYPLLLIFFATNSMAQNVMISDLNSPNEPSIAMDFEHPEYLVAGTNTNNYHYSTDSGRTWTSKILTSQYGVWGDPIIKTDTAGDFYFFHLSNPEPGQGNWIDRMVCQKSTNHGQTWNDGTFTGKNFTELRHQDKHGVVVDRKRNIIYMAWTQFDEYQSIAPGDSTTILFSKSYDAGETWSTAQRISFYAGTCLDSDRAVEGATLAVDPNGHVYVVWQSEKGICLNVSEDEGETWFDKERIIHDLPGGWDFDIPGILRCNGFPVLSCDLSGGQNHGTLYLNWSDQRNGEEDTDIWLIKSANQGNTWSERTRVNQDAPGNQQFLTWMDIDQTTGFLYFVYYDRRAYSDNRTDVILAYSEDGGTTFEERRINENSFYPWENIFFGDYNHIVAHNGVIRPIWTQLDQGRLSVWTDLSSHNKLASLPDTYTEQIEMRLYPNPVTDVAYVSFKLRQPSVIGLDLYNFQGSKMKSILDQVNFEYGKHIIPYNAKVQGLTPGHYVMVLTINGVVYERQIIIVQ